MQWIQDLFGVHKPIIAMCHLHALPGDPDYDAEKGVEWIVEARKDLQALQDGGVDAVMFSNEYSLPYLLKVEPITHVTMARVIGELMHELRVPFGVNVLWDPIASIELAVATGGGFVREIFSGLYASDFGLWNTNCGEAPRHRRASAAKRYGCCSILSPKRRSIWAIAKSVPLRRSTVFNTQPDALCVSGLIAGAEHHRIC